MNQDKFPGMSPQEDDEPGLGDILKRSNPQPFSLNRLLSEATFSNNEQENKDQDDEDDEKAKKKKKTNAWRGIFAVALNSEEKITQPEITVGVSKKEEQTFELQDPKIDAEDIEDVSIQHNNEQLVTLDDQENSYDRVNLHGKDQDVAYQSSESNEVVDRSVGDQTEDPPKQINRTVYETSELPPTYAPPTPSELLFSENKPAEARQEQVKVVEEKKPVGAVLAFLGADLLSRRRDKKLERKLDKESKTTAKKLEQIESDTKNIKDPESVESIIRRIQNQRGQEVKENFSKNNYQSVSENSLITSTENEVMGKGTKRRPEASQTLLNETSSTLASRYGNFERPNTTNEKDDYRTTTKTAEMYQGRGYEGLKQKSQSHYGQLDLGVDAVTQSELGLDTENKYANRLDNPTHEILSNNQQIKLTDYKSSISLGVAVALIILSIFIYYYFS